MANTESQAFIDSLNINSEGGGTGYGEYIPYDDGDIQTNLQYVASQRSIEIPPFIADYVRGVSKLASGEQSASLIDSVKNKDNAYKGAYDYYHISESHDKLHGSGDWVPKYRGTFQYGQDNEARMEAIDAKRGTLDKAFTIINRTAIKAGRGAVLDLGAFVYGIGTTIATGELESFYNNDMTKWMDDIDQISDAYRKVYHTDKDFGFNLATFDEVAAGSEFTLRMLGSEAILAALTGGTSLTSTMVRQGSKLGRLANVGSKSSKLLNTFSKATKASKNFMKGLAGRSVQVAGQGTRTAEVVAGIGLNSARAAERGGILGGKVAQSLKTARYVIGSSAYEAGFEARHMEHEAIDDFYQYYDKIGRTPTEQEIINFERGLKTAKQNVFAANMAILSLSNIAMFPKLAGLNMPKIGIASKINAKIDSKIFGLGTTLVGDTYKPIATNFFKKGTKMGTRMLRNSLIEGVYEEGSQGIASEMAKNYMKFGLDDGYISKVNDYGQSFTHAFNKQWGTAEGREEMYIGMVIGGLFGGSAAVKSTLNDYNMQKDVAKLQNFEKNNSSDIISAVIQQAIGGRSASNIAQLKRAAARLQGVEAQMAEGKDNNISVSELLISLMEANDAVGRDNDFIDVISESIKGMTEEEFKSFATLAEGQNAESIDINKSKEDITNFLSEHKKNYERSLKYGKLLFDAESNSTAALQRADGTMASNQELARGYAYVATMGKASQHFAESSYNNFIKVLASNSVGKDITNALAAVKILQSDKKFYEGLKEKLGEVDKLKEEEKSFLDQIKSLQDESTKDENSKETVAKLAKVQEQLLNNRQLQEEVGRRVNVTISSLNLNESEHANGGSFVEFMSRAKEVGSEALTEMETKLKELDEAIDQYAIKDPQAANDIRSAYQEYKKYQVANISFSNLIGDILSSDNKMSFMSGFFSGARARSASKNMTGTTSKIVNTLTSDSVRGGRSLVFNSLKAKTAANIERDVLDKFESGKEESVKSLALQIQRVYEKSLLGQKLNNTEKELLDKVSEEDYQRALQMTSTDPMQILESFYERQLLSEVSLANIDVLINELADLIESGNLSEEDTQRVVELFEKAKQKKSSVNGTLAERYKIYKYFVANEPLGQPFVKVEDTTEAENENESSYSLDGRRVDRNLRDRTSEELKDIYLDNLYEELFTSKYNPYSSMEDQILWALANAEVTLLDYTDNGSNTSIEEIADIEKRREDVKRYIELVALSVRTSEQQEEIDYLKEKYKDAVIVNNTYFDGVEFSTIMDLYQQVNTYNGTKARDILNEYVKRFEEKSTFSFNTETSTVFDQSKPLGVLKIKDSNEFVIEDLYSLTLPFILSNIGQATFEVVSSGNSTIYKGNSIQEANRLLGEGTIMRVVTPSMDLTVVKGGGVVRLKSADNNLDILGNIGLSTTTLGNKEQVLTKEGTPLNNGDLLSLAQINLNELRNNVGGEFIPGNTEEAGEGYYYVFDVNNESSLYVVDEKGNVVGLVPNTEDISDIQLGMIDVYDKNNLSTIEGNKTTVFVRAVSSGVVNNEVNGSRLSLNMGDNGLFAKEVNIAKHNVVLLDSEGKVIEEINNPAMDENIFKGLSTETSHISKLELLDGIPAILLEKNGVYVAVPIMVNNTSNNKLLNDFEQLHSDEEVSREERMFRLNKILIEAGAPKSLLATTDKYIEGDERAEWGYDVNEIREFLQGVNGYIVSDISELKDSFQNSENYSFTSFIDVDKGLTEGVSIDISSEVIGRSSTEEETTESTEEDNNTPPKDVIEDKKETPKNEVETTEEETEARQSFLKKSIDSVVKGFFNLLGIKLNEDLLLSNSNPILSATLIADVEGYKSEDKFTKKELVAGIRSRLFTLNNIELTPDNKVKVTLKESAEGKTGKFSFFLPISVGKKLVDLEGVMTKEEALTFLNLLLENEIEEVEKLLFKSKEEESEESNNLASWLKHNQEMQSPIEKEGTSESQSDEGSTSTDTSTDGEEESQKLVESINKLRGEFKKEGNTFIPYITKSDKEFIDSFNQGSEEEDLKSFKERLVKIKGKYVNRYRKEIKSKIDNILLKDTTNKIATTIEAEYTQIEDLKSLDVMNTTLKTEDSSLRKEMSSLVKEIDLKKKSLLSLNSDYVKNYIEERGLSPGSTDTLKDLQNKIRELNKLEEKQKENKDKGVLIEEINTKRQLINTLNNEVFKKLPNINLKKASENTLREHSRELDTIISDLAESMVSNQAQSQDAEVNIREVFRDVYQGVLSSIQKLDEELYNKLSLTEQEWESMTEEEMSSKLNEIIAELNNFTTNKSKTLKKKVDDLVKDVEKLRDISTSLQGGIKELTKLELKKTKLEDLLNKLKAENDLGEDTLKVLEERQAVILAEIDELKEKVKEKKAQVKKMQSLIEESASGALSEELKELKKELKKLGGKISSVDEIESNGSLEILSLIKKEIKGLINKANANLNILRKTLLKLLGDKKSILIGGLKLTKASINKMTVEELSEVLSKFSKEVASKEEDLKGKQIDNLLSVVDSIASILTSLGVEHESDLYNKYREERTNVTEKEANKLISELKAKLGEYNAELEGKQGEVATLMKKLREKGVSTDQYEVSYQKLNLMDLTNLLADLRDKEDKADLIREIIQKRNELAEKMQGVPSLEVETLFQLDRESLLDIKKAYQENLNSLNQAKNNEGGVVSTSSQQDDSGTPTMPQMDDKATQGFFQSILKILNDAGEAGSEILKSLVDKAKDDFSLILDKRKKDKLKSLKNIARGRGKVSMTLGERVKWFSDAVEAYEKTDQSPEGKFLIQLNYLLDHYNKVINQPVADTTKRGELLDKMSTFINELHKRYNSLEGSNAVEFFKRDDNDTINKLLDDPSTRLNNQDVLSVLREGMDDIYSLYMGVYYLVQAEQGYNEKTNSITGVVKLKMLNSNVSSNIANTGLDVASFTKFPANILINYLNTFKEKSVGMYSPISSLLLKDSQKSTLADVANILLKAKGVTKVTQDMQGSRTSGLQLNHSPLYQNDKFYLDESTFKYDVYKELPDKSGYFNVETGEIEKKSKKSTITVHINKGVIDDSGNVRDDSEDILNNIYKYEFEMNKKGSKEGQYTVYMYAGSNKMDFMQDSTKLTNRNGEDFFLDEKGKPVVYKIDIKVLPAKQNQKEEFIIEENRLSQSTFTGSVTIYTDSALTKDVLNNALRIGSKEDASNIKQDEGVDKLFLDSKGSWDNKNPIVAFYNNYKNSELGAKDTDDEQGIEYAQSMVLKHKKWLAKVVNKSQGDDLDISVLLNGLEVKKEKDFLEKIIALTLLYNRRSLLKGRFSTEERKVAIEDYIDTVADEEIEKDRGDKFVQHFDGLQDEGVIADKLKLDFSPLLRNTSNQHMLWGRSFTAMGLLGIKAGIVETTNTKGNVKYKVSLENSKGRDIEGFLSSKGLKVNNAFNFQYIGKDLINYVEENKNLFDSNISNDGKRIQGSGAISTIIFKEDTGDVLVTKLSGGYNSGVVDFHTTSNNYGLRNDYSRLDRGESDKMSLTQDGVAITSPLLLDTKTTDNKKVKSIKTELFGRLNQKATVAFNSKNRIVVVRGDVKNAIRKGSTIESKKKFHLTVEKGLLKLGLEVNEEDSKGNVKKVTEWFGRNKNKTQFTLPTNTSISDVINYFNRQPTIGSNKFKQGDLTIEILQDDSQEKKKKGKKGIFLHITDSAGDLLYTLSIKEKAPITINSKPKRGIGSVSKEEISDNLNCN